MNLPPPISEEASCEAVPPEGMDELLAHGWRHFGIHFFRYSLQIVDGEWQGVVPLRIDLRDFALSKSQRRVLRRNADIECTISPAMIDDEVRAMFQQHKLRFADNVPNDITDFISETPATLPSRGMELRCRLDGRLVAASYIDVGSHAVSSIYGVFDVEQAKRSLGIFTMLMEIEFAKGQGMQFYYPGYATTGRSHYDYKKQFSGLQGYDWTKWKPFAEVTGELPEIA